MIKIIIDHESYFNIYFYFKSTIRSLESVMPINEILERLFFWVSVTEKDDKQVTIELDSKFIIKFMKQVAWAFPTIFYSTHTLIKSLKALDKNLGSLLREKDEEQG